MTDEQEERLSEKINSSKFSNSLLGCIVFAVVYFNGCKGCGGTYDTVNKLTEKVDSLTMIIKNHEKNTKDNIR